MSPHEGFTWIDGVWWVCMAIFFSYGAQLFFVTFFGDFKSNARIACITAYLEKKSSLLHLIGACAATILFFMKYFVRH